MSATQTLHTRVIDITEDYLGPAASRFISRIATNHLGKPATQLNKKDIPELVTWVQLAANVMSENAAAIDQYVSRLRALEKADDAKTQRTTVQFQRLAH